MISYEPLRRTLYERKMSIADLSKLLKAGSMVTGTKIRENKGGARFVNAVCEVLNCNVEDVICWSEKEKSEVPRRNYGATFRGTGITLDFNKIVELLPKRMGIEEFSLSVGKSRSWLRGKLLRGGGVTRETVDFLCEKLGCNEDDILADEESKKFEPSIRIDWDKLGNILKDKGLTMKQVSLNMGRNKDYLVNMKKNEKTRIDIVKELCKELDCTVEEIKANEIQ